MGLTIAQKILKNHLTEGELRTGTEVALHIDQTLTQDATGTMAYLALEKMGIERVKTELSVAYIDHNTLQCGFENADDALYIKTVARRYGIVFSPAGNGICHQLHLENFGKPGKTLIGSDSHTPTCGALGMLAMGAGGMDVAVAMAGVSYRITVPKMMKVELSGTLRRGVSAKDLALELLRRISVKGGVGYVIEWSGKGVENLSVPQRATICNMGAETGALCTVFPSDEQTLHFLSSYCRPGDFSHLTPDSDAFYDKTVYINASEVVPLIACPHSPDNVVPVSSVASIPVSQVCIGSCTNSSLRDLLAVQEILKGKKISQNTELSISPGTRSILKEIIKNNALQTMVNAGARILECTCGPCIGMGFSPVSSGVSLRTFNRNFQGRSGTPDANVYLCSPETAAVSALEGKITDPLKYFDNSVKDCLQDDIRETCKDNFIFPVQDQTAVHTAIVRGPNIKAMPDFNETEDKIKAKVILKASDNVTTDHIMPAGAKILPYRSNIPKLSEFCFSVLDSSFYEKAKNAGSSFIVAGENYGQGSSREHAALVPRYLGVRAVICKFFARIHKANLVNAGILPLTFEDSADYDRIKENMVFTLENVLEGIKTGLYVLTSEENFLSIRLQSSLSDYQKKVLIAGGLMNYIKKRDFYK